MDESVIHIVSQLRIPCKGSFFADEDSINKASGKGGHSLKGAVGISVRQPAPEGMGRDHAALSGDGERKPYTEVRSRPN